MSFSQADLGSRSLMTCRPPAPLRVRVCRLDVPFGEVLSVRIFGSFFKSKLFDVLVLDFTSSMSLTCRSFPRRAFCRALLPACAGPLLLSRVVLQTLSAEAPISEHGVRGALPGGLCSRGHRAAVTLPCGLK